MCHARLLQNVGLLTISYGLCVWMNIWANRGQQAMIAFHSAKNNRACRLYEDIHICIHKFRRHGAPLFYSICIHVIHVRSVSSLLGWCISEASKKRRWRPTMKKAPSLQPQAVKRKKFPPLVQLRSALTAFVCS
jgi:hypothetical protein